MLKGLFRCGLPPSLRTQLWTNPEAHCDAARAHLDLHHGPVGQAREAGGARSLDTTGGHAVNVISMSV